MLTPTEREEIRQLVDTELADIEDQCAHAGSYHYLCRVNGNHVLTHHPVGRVLRQIPPHEHVDDEQEVAGCP
jgi:hypothetical protein